MVPFMIFFLLSLQSAWGEDGCTAEYSCISCTEVRICANISSQYQELTRFTCPSSAPYCDVTGSCSYLPTLACANLDVYPCTQDGSFPNPTDCQKFRVCKNGTSYAFTCPSYYNYDSTQATCVRGATCYTISCYGKSGTKVPYNDPGIYAYCVDSTAVLVERCPGSYQLDTTSQKCAPVCQAVGNKIPDVEDCTKYFYCSKEPYSSDYTVTSEQCSQGYGFDPTFLRCVPLAALPSCNAE